MLKGYNITEILQSEKNIIMHKKITAIIFAFLAAVFYATSTPFSKLLLANVPATYMAAFLYIGAGLGVGIMYVFNRRKESGSEPLTKNDLPYVLGMIALDILAPIFLMIGISIGSASNASLLGNFEIVATSLVALLIFKETVSKKLWLAIALITAASIILSFNGSGSLEFSYGSLFVLLATACWGFENNCTRSISGKSTYEIVIVKGLCSGAGSFVIAMIIGEKLPGIRFIFLALLLGYVAYGLSIFLYVRAQRDLGAAKTSAYYAVAPFVGSFLSFVVNDEKVTGAYFLALVVMIAGTVFVVSDTLVSRHSHEHTHTVTHTHDGETHTHVIEHSHGHKHVADSENHGRHHSGDELKEMLAAEHKRR